PGAPACGRSRGSCEAPLLGAPGVAFFGRGRDRQSEVFERVDGGQVPVVVERGAADPADEAGVVAGGPGSDGRRGGDGGVGGGRAGLGRWTRGGRGVGRRRGGGWVRVRPAARGGFTSPAA